MPQIYSEKKKFNENSIGTFSKQKPWTQTRRVQPFEYVKSKHFQSMTNPGRTEGATPENFEIFML